MNDQKTGEIQGQDLRKIVNLQLCELGHLEIWKKKKKMVVILTTFQWFDANPFFIFEIGLRHIKRIIYLTVWIHKWLI